MKGKGLFSKKEQGPSVTLNEGRLTVDCTACGGSSDISDIRCAACICGVLKGAGELESIHLRSATDTSYLGESAELLRDLSSVYSMLLADVSGRKGSRCGRCRKSFSHIVADQIPLFPDIDTAMLKDRVDQIPAGNDVCRICINDSARMIGEIERSLADIARRLKTEEGEE